MKLFLTLLLATVAIATGAQELDGKTLFAKNCAACHQLAGTGIEGAFPALKGNSYVQGDASQVIATVLKGRAGMPSFATSLDDEKIALTLSYIRQAWGNHAEGINTQDVTSIRAQSRVADAIGNGPKPTPSH